MPAGPGKYDDHCTQLRETTQAEAAIIMVFNGIHGSGFSVQGTPETVAHLPGLLENMAKQIRESAN